MKEQRRLPTTTATTPRRSIASSSSFFLLVSFLNLLQIDPSTSHKHQQQQKCSLPATTTTTTTTTTPTGFQLFQPWPHKSHSRGSPETQETTTTQSAAFATSAPAPATTTPRPTPTPPPAANVVMRAWTCHGRNQRDLVDRLKQATLVTSPHVQAVMTRIDRQHYVVQQDDVGGNSSPLQNTAYQDAPQSIGLGQTISAPHMHARVLEEMIPHVQKAIARYQQQERQEEVRLLDVGCGSGYLTACLGRWVQPPLSSQEQPEHDSSGGSTDTDCYLGHPGRVFGVDIRTDLVQWAASNLRRGNDGDLLDRGTVTLQTVNGWQGLPAAAPFDAIHVGAAAASLPTALAAQLKVGGVLLIPIGPEGQAQKLYKIERIAQTPTPNTTENNNASTTASFPFTPSDYRMTELLGVRYVPLIQGPVHSGRTS